MGRLEKGVLIVLDGIDGGGKTTQALRLLRVLSEKGYQALYYREPSEGRWGRLIREKAGEEASLTPDQELDLFQRDRRENVERNLKPAMEARRVVVLDRYYFSTMAYQGAKGLDPEYIRRINESFAVIPDLIFILDVDPAHGLKRTEGRGRRDLLFEREDYLHAVRSIFRSLRGDAVFHIDASRPEDEVSGDICAVALDYLAFFTMDE